VVVTSEQPGATGAAGTTFSEEAFCPNLTPYVVNAGYYIDADASVQEGVNVSQSMPFPTNGSPASSWIVSGILTKALTSTDTWILYVFVECSP